MKEATLSWLEQDKTRIDQLSNWWQQKFDSKSAFKMFINLPRHVWLHHVNFQGKR